MTTDLIVGLGGGGVIGSIVVALIGAIAGRGKSRAEAAQIITTTAASLAAEVNKELGLVREELSTVRTEMRQTREAVDHLTERVDEVLPLLEADHPLAAAALRRANSTVKRVI
ncbi:hypothetical protein ACXYTP_23765 [Tsukamurella ocularis]|uniref:hypothetical protein n=1 Tax=Tsukamurella ocularis TaxID=1970234 RepID=UPI0039F0385A